MLIWSWNYLQWWILKSHIFCQKSTYSREIIAFCEYNECQSLSKSAKNCLLINNDSLGALFLLKSFFDNFNFLYIFCWFLILILPQFYFLPISSLYLSYIVLCMAPNSSQSTNKVPKLGINKMFSPINLSRNAERYRCEQKAIIKCTSFCDIWGFC